MSKAILKNLTNSLLSTPSPFGVVLKPFQTVSLSGINQFTIDQNAINPLLKSGNLSLTFVEDSQVDDSLEAAGITGVDITLESLVLNVDPNSGTDPAISSRINKQNVLDLITFKTIAAAVEAIPSNVKHTITIKHVDGDFGLPGGVGEPFGSYSRFKIAFTKSINFRSASLTERIAATTSYGVTSYAAPTSTVPGTIVLSSDPGVAVNFFRGTFVKVISGTGSPQYGTVASSSGTSILLAGVGMFTAINATSVVEFHQPSLRLTLTSIPLVPPFNNYVVPGPGFNPFSSGVFPDDYANLGYQPASGFSTSARMGWAGFDLISTISPAHLLNLGGCDLALNLFRTVGTVPRLLDGVLSPNLAVFKGVTAGNCLRVTGGAMQMVSTSGVLCWNGLLGLNLLNVGNAANYPSARIFNMSFALIGSHAINMQGPGHLVGFGPASVVHLFVDTVTGSLFSLLKGSFLELPTGFFGVLPSGSGGDVLLDGVAKTYATIDGDANKTQLGVKGSVVTV